MGYMMIARGEEKGIAIHSNKMDKMREEKILIEREKKQLNTASSDRNSLEDPGKQEQRLCPNCSACRKKVRDEKEYKDLIHRLNRIEGQVRGVKRMVEEDVYCVDILTQVAAITSALNSFNKVLLGNHIKTCVADDIRRGNDEAVDELVTTLQKLMK